MTIFVGGNGGNGVPELLDFHGAGMNVGAQGAYESIAVTSGVPLILTAPTDQRVLIHLLNGSPNLSSLIIDGDEKLSNAILAGQTLPIDLASGATADRVYYNTTQIAQRLIHEYPIVGSVIQLTFNASASIDIGWRNVT